jgi:hypothetical protein
MSKEAANGYSVLYRTSEGRWLPFRCQSITRRWGGSWFETKAEAAEALRTVKAGFQWDTFRPGQSLVAQVLEG